MSLDNHPNFHAVRFAASILQSFYSSLRGKANMLNAPDIDVQLRAFVEAIEQDVNRACGESVAENYIVSLMFDDHESYYEITKVDLEELRKCKNAERGFTYIVDNGKFAIVSSTAEVTAELNAEFGKQEWKDFLESFN